MMNQVKGRKLLRNFPDRRSWTFFSSGRREEFLLMYEYIGDRISCLISRRSFSFSLRTFWRKVSLILVLSSMMLAGLSRFHFFITSLARTRAKM